MTTLKYSEIFPTQEDILEARLSTALDLFFTPLDKNCFFSMNRTFFAFRVLLRKKIKITDIRVTQ